MIKRIVLWAGLALLVSLSVAQAQQPYPNRTVRVVVPTSAGGVTDVLARLVAQGLYEAWKTTVIVDNRPGADGVLGLEQVYRGDKEGYTLLVTSDAYLTATPHLTQVRRYDTLKDFTPIAMLGEIAPTFNVPASLPVNTFKEFLALAKAKPGELNYGSMGIGTYAHLAMEDLQRMAGIKLVHIPYKGSTPATTALLRGETSAMIVNLGVVESQAEAGKIKILAAAGAKRSQFRPDLPTIAEQGVPGFSTGAWWGVFGPSGMQPEVVDKIRTTIAALVDTPSVQTFFKKQTIEPVSMTSEEFANLVQDDYKRWGELIKVIGIPKH